MDRIQWLRVDLAEGMDHVPPVDAIIHAAAHTHLIPNSVMADYVSANVEGTEHLAAYARRTHVRYVVHLSTLSAYGDLPGGLLTEDTPFLRPAAYGATKYLCELILGENVAHFGSLNIRLPGVVAAGYFTPWIGRVVQKALKDEPITIYNPNGLFNNIVHVAELARFIGHVLAQSPKTTETVNLGAGEPLPIREIVQTILKEARSRSSITEEVSEKDSFYIDIDKVRHVFGFEPLPTRAIVTHYVQENLSHRSSGLVPSAHPA